MRKQVGFCRLVFIAFSLIAVTLDMNIAFLSVQNLDLAGLTLPLFHPGGHFVSLGTSWGTKGAAGRTHGGPEPDDGKHSPE